MCSGSSLYLSCFVCVLRVYVWDRMLDLVFYCLFVGSVVLFIVGLSFVECSTGFGVNSIVCGFQRFRF